MCSCNCRSSSVWATGCDVGTVANAVVWYNQPLPDELTNKDGPEYKGFTPKQMQERGAFEWQGPADRNGRRPRYQRWAEWQQLMSDVAKVQLEISNERGCCVNVDEAAAAVDAERAEKSVTQFVKSFAERRREEA